MKKKIVTLLLGGFEFDVYVEYKREKSINNYVKDNKLVISP